MLELRVAVVQCNWRCARAQSYIHLIDIERKKKKKIIPIQTSYTIAATVLMKTQKPFGMAFNFKIINHIHANCLFWYIE